MFVCVCVFVFMHVFANVFGYALLFLFSNVQGCVYVCASLWLCVWESLCVCVWLLCMHECVFVAQRVCVCVQCFVKKAKFMDLENTQGQCL